MLSLKYILLKISKSIEYNSVFKSRQGHPTLKKKNVFCFFYASQYLCSSLLSAEWVKGYQLQLLDKQIHETYPTAYHTHFNCCVTNNTSLLCWLPNSIGKQDDFLTFYLLHASDSSTDLRSVLFSTNSSIQLDNTGKKNVLFKCNSDTGKHHTTFNNLQNNNCHFQGWQNTALLNALWYCMVH